MPEFTRDRPQPPPELPEVDGGEVITNRFEKREIWEGKVGFRAAAPENGRAALASLPLQLARQACFADSRLAGQDHDPALAALDGEQRVLQRSQLLFAIYQDRTQCPLDGRPPPRGAPIIESPGKRSGVP